MNLGILLWNKCNASCSHCAVSSGPLEGTVLTDDEIFKAIDAAFYDGSPPKIGLSGGEAFLYFRRLEGIIRYATSKGATISVNTNGSWATSVEYAVKKLSKLKSAGLSRLVVSADDFHSEYIDEIRPMMVIRACKIVHLEVELQFVATKKTGRLADLLARHGDTLLNVRCREIPCHPVGRAAKEVPIEDLFLQPNVPRTPCPSAILSIAADGRVIPCCNSAGHLPSLQVGHIREPLEDVHQKFISSPLLRVLVSEGPAALLESAKSAGYRERSQGYIDQCDLCYDIFRNPQAAKAAKAEAVRLAEERIFKQYFSDFYDAPPSIPANEC